MTKIIMSLGLCLIVSFSFAQNANKKQIDRKTESFQFVKPAQNKIRSNSTETIIFSENFSNGIPATWSNYGTDGNGNPSTNAVWEYRGPNTTPNNTVGSRGAYSGGTGPIQSPTASNGFVIFDSDFLDNDGTPGQAGFGTGDAPAPHVGYLESPVINLASDNFVELSFASHIRYFEGKARVQFSTNGGTTWTTPKNLHDDIRVNDANASNQILAIDVSNYIGGEANAKIRFMYDGTFDDPGVSGDGNAYYFWQLDDIEIRELPQNELRFTDLFNGAPSKDIIYGTTPGESKYGIISLKQTREIAFDCNVYNYGSGTQYNVEFEVDIVEESTNNVVTTLSAPSVAMLAYQDTIDFNTFTTSSSWTPSQEMNYLAVLKITSDSLPNLSMGGINDTFRIAVTDSVMSLDFQNISNGIGTTSTGEPDGLEIAVRLDLKQDERLFGANLRIVGSQSAAGAFMEVEVYDTTGFELVSGFISAPLAYVEHTVDAADVSSNQVYIDFTDENGVPLYLENGGYYITVRMYSNEDANPITLANDASVVQTQRSAIFYIPTDQRWYIGYNSSRALNSPLIRMITCPAASASDCMQISVEELSKELNLKIGQNPENIFLHFNDARGTFNLRLTDINGTPVYNNKVDVNGAHRETISSNHLSTGVYILMVEQNGKMNTYKLIVQ